MDARPAEPPIDIEFEPQSSRGEFIRPLLKLASGHGRRTLAHRDRRHKGIADAYAVMDERRAIKPLVRVGTL